MSFLVLAYPTISQKDYNWIQKFRKKYDNRYYKIVKPHFTIVFPVNRIEESIFIKHIVELSKDNKQIDFTLKCSIIVKDSFSDFTDIFLIPDEGNSEIIRLHDKFYTGVLTSELRLDIPFIPHIGIGASKNSDESKKLSDKINENNFCIKGTINSLNITWYDYPKINTIKNIQLNTSKN
ncbi:MAG: 2'-5' RNA ligase family protein [Ignavibacteria bacterium]